MPIVKSEFCDYEVMTYHNPNHVPVNKIYNNGESASLAMYGYDGLSRAYPESWLCFTVSETIPAGNGSRTKEIMITLHGEDAKELVRHAANALGMRIE